MTEKSKEQQKNPKGFDEYGNYGENNGPVT